MNGITVSEFTCLARCQGLTTQVKYGSEVEEDEFRRDVQSVCSGKSSFIALNFSRGVLGQTVRMMFLDHFKISGCSCFCWVEAVSE